jgi:hypothetical protein
MSPDTIYLLLSVLNIVTYGIISLTPIYLSTNIPFQIAQLTKNSLLLLNTANDIKNNKYYGIDMLKVRSSLCLNIIISVLFMYIPDNIYLILINAILYIKYFTYNDLFFLTKMVEWFPTLDFRLSSAVNLKVNFLETVQYYRSDNTDNFIPALIYSALSKTGLIIEEYILVISILIGVFYNTEFNKEYASITTSLGNINDYYIDNTLSIIEVFKDGKIIQNVESLFAKDYSDVKFKTKCDYEVVKGGIKLTLLEYADITNNKTYTKNDDAIWSNITSQWKKYIAILKGSGIHTILHGLNSIIYNNALSILGEDDDIFKFIYLFTYSDEGFLSRAGVAFRDLPSYLPIMTVSKLVDKKEYFKNYEIEDILKSQTYHKVLFPDIKSLPDDYTTMNIYKLYINAINKFVKDYVSKLNINDDKYQQLVDSVNNYMKIENLDLIDVISIVIKNNIIHHSIHAGLVSLTVRNLHSLNNIDYLVKKFIKKDNQAPFSNFMSELKEIEKYCEDNNNIVLCPSLINPYISY